VSPAGGRGPGSSRGPGSGRWPPGGWPEPSRPRPVTGGIRARSKRGSIGERWWSRRFIDVLESFCTTGRLSRGRNYARRGQVLWLTVRSGYVDASVQGSRENPYHVRIQVLPLTTAQWQRVIAALAAQAVYRARLLAGEMPAEIEEVFAGCGTPLFPRGWRDLEMSCSCPDWEVPCKHLAAVCYVLAERFDDDPFDVLAWRGKGRDELLAALRGRGTGAAGAEPGGVAGLDPEAVAAGPAGPPLADVLGGFWSAGLSPARLRALPPAPAAPPGLLLRAFEPPDVLVHGQDLAALLQPAYLRLAGQDENQAPAASPSAPGPAP
jgi:uncharacterized Zn finger protein